MATKTSSKSKGTAGPDLVQLGATSDRYEANAGNDTVYGGAGNDFLWGQAGADVLYGQDGDDQLDGGADDDTVVGGDGNDVLIGSTGSDQLIGGAGTDTLDYSAYMTPVRIDLAAGIADKGSSGTDSLAEFEVVIGGSGADHITGSNVDEILVGGVGADTMTGGGGSDRYALRAASESTIVQPDTVTDFTTWASGTPGRDRIDLSAIAPKGGFSWGGTQAVKSGVWYRQIDGNTEIFVDAGKDGIADMRLVFTGLHVLSNTDFAGVQNTGPLAGHFTAEASAKDGEAPLTSGGDGVLVHVTDADSGAVLRVTNSGTQMGSYGVLELASDGSYTYTLNANQSTVTALAEGQIVTETFSYFVSDGLITSSASFTIRVVGTNDPPEGAAPAFPQGITEDQPFTVTTAELLQGFSDPDGGTLAVANLSASNGSLTADGNGDWIFLPNADFFGLTTLSYEVIDGQGGSTQAEVSFWVVGVNDAPQAATGADAQVARSGEAFTYTLPDDLFSDADGDGLTLSATLADGSPLPAWLQFDPVTGVFSGTPTAFSQSPLALSVKATDPSGASATWGLSIAVVDGALIEGTDGNDSLVGTLYGDLIVGYLGDDTLSGDPRFSLRQYGAGDDVIFGDSGNDRLFGGVGNDWLDGGEGDDYLDGGSGSDTFIGGEGNDKLQSIGGSQIVILGGAGDDHVYFSLTASGAAIDTGDGADLVQVGHLYEGTYTLTLGAERDTLVISGLSEGLVVTDFAAGAGGDLLDLNHLLSYYASGWDGNSNPFGNGYLRLVQQGNDTLLQFNADGPFSEVSAYTTLVTLQGVAATELTSANFWPDFNPDGGATPGDTWVGTDDDESRMGTAGDDQLSGQRGNDTLYGGPGHDLIDGGAGNDALHGDAGDDHLDGGDDNDAVNGGLGNDTLIGGAGADSMNGGEGNDWLDGGEGDDHLDGDSGSDTLIGGEGNDELVSIGGSQIVMLGGAGDDHVYLALSSTGAAIDTGDGADLVEVGGLYEGTYTLTLGAERDTLVISGLSEGLVVTDFAAGAGGDLLDLNPLLTNYTTGWDRTSNPFGSGYLRLVQQGADTLVQADEYFMIGSPYAVFLTLQGVAATDLTSDNFWLGFNPDGSGVPGEVWVGTDDSDYRNGTERDDHLSGSLGDDTLSGLGGSDVIVGGAGADLLMGDAGGDRLDGGDGDDRLFGYMGNDTLIGGAGDDWLLDYGGDDSLVGGDGNDVLSGGEDSDTLIGGAGQDTLNGGIGADIFVFALTDGPEIDTVHDFNASAPTSLGGDALNIADLLDGYDAGVHDLLDFVALTASGNDAAVSVDRDGAGDAYSMEAVVLLSDMAVGITGVQDWVSKGHLIITD